MAHRAYSWGILVVLTASLASAAPPPPFFAAEGDGVFTLILDGSACHVRAEAAFVWESTAADDIPKRGAFHALSPPAPSCYGVQVSEGYFDSQCAGHQTVGIRCASGATSSSLTIADDGAFSFRKPYPSGTIVYVNGTLGGVMPCQGSGGSYLYYPCPGTATRGLPDL